MITSTFSHGLGEMNRRVTIRRWGYITQLNGGIVPVQTLAYPVWAKVESGGGRILTDSQQQQWSYDYKVTLRYEVSRPLYNNDTIDYDGSRLVIRSTVIQDEGNRKFITVQCSTVGGISTDNLSTMLNTLNYTGVGGETVTNIPALHGKVIKGAFKDGIEFKVILSGTPIDKQVLFNNSTDNLTWSVPFVPGENGFIQYADI